MAGVVLFVVSCVVGVSIAGDACDLCSGGAIKARDLKATGGGRGKMY